MTAVDYYQRGFNEVSKNIVGWAAFFFVFMLVVGFSMGLGGVFSANVMREVRRSLDEGRAPDVNAIFRMDNINNDVVNWFIFVGAVMLGGLVGGLGGTVAAVVLQMHMPLAAKNRYQPMDNAKLSWRHVSTHVADHIVFFLVGVALTAVAAMFCFLPLLLVAPVSQAALMLWFKDSEGEIDGFAAGDGLKPIASIEGTP